MPNELLDAASALLNPPLSDQTVHTPARGAYPMTDPRTVEQEEANTLQMVMERIAHAEHRDMSFKERALLHWVQVQSVLPAEWPFFSRYFDPETENAAFKIIEAVMAPIYQRDTLCRVKSLDDQGDIQRELMQLVMDTVLRDYIQYKQSLYYQFQETIVFGNGVVRHFIRPREVTTRRQQPIMAGEEFGIQIGTEPVEEKHTEWWPDRSNVSRFDFTPGPTGKTIQKMPYCGERLVLPLETAKHLGRQAGYRHVDELQGDIGVDRQEGYALGPWSEQNFDIKARLEAIGHTVRDGTVAGSELMRYATLRIYCEAPANGEGGERMIVVGDNKLVMYDSKWPRPGAPKGGNPHHHGLKPYSETSFSRPRSGQLWHCKGVPEILEDQQYLLNGLTNTAQDMIAEQRDPMTLISDDAGVEDISELNREPGKKVRVNNIEGIKDWVATQVPQDVWINMQRVRNNMNRYADTPSIQSGAVTGQDKLSGGADTLGGLELLANQAMQSKTFTLLFMEQGVEDGLNLTAQDAQQCLIAPVKMQITGHMKSLKQAGYRGFAVVRPDDIQGKFHVSILGPSRTMSSEQKAKLMMQGMQVANGAPEVKDRIKQLDDWVELMELWGFDDPMRLLLSDDEYEKKQAGMSQVPHPTPDMLKELIKQLENLPPDVQAQVFVASGLLPSQIGGSSPVEKYIADIVKSLLSKKETQPVIQ